MARPSVSIALTNGQLGILPPTEFGTSVAVIASPVAPVSGYGVVKLITTKADAETEYAQSGNEAVLKAIKSGFYAEAPEGTKLYVLCMAQATTLQTMVAAANAEKPLNSANGAARLVGVIKYPSGAYTPTITNGFDADVHLAVTDAQTLAESWLLKKKPFRFIIQGYACSGVSAAAKDYNATANRNGAIVASEVGGDGGLATMIALGRAARVLPQQNIGRIKTGSLNIAEADAVTIGGTALNSVAASTLDGYYDKRYITIEKNQVDSGYVFTDDNALTVTTDDYNSLSNGRVIDNMVRVAFATYYEQLKDDVDVDDNGRLGTVAEKALQAAIINAVNLNMASQLSKKKDGTAQVTCLVNPSATDYAALYAANSISPNLNLLSGGNVYIFIGGTPKGQLKNIGVVLGFSL